MTRLTDAEASARMRLTTMIVPIANATPMHSTTTATFASVSPPVWSVRSQLSNNSAIGAPRLMTRIVPMASRRSTSRECNTRVSSGFLNADLTGRISNGYDFRSSRDAKKPARC
jgi:hypothetical protein